MDNDSASNLIDMDENASVCSYLSARNFAEDAMFYRTTLSVALFLMSFSLSLGQDHIGSIKGLVTDRRTKESLPDVAVIVVGTSNGASTDGDGNFTLAALAAGAYSLQFRLVGYEPYVRTDVVVSPGRVTRVAVELHERAIQEEEVTATRGYFSKSDAVEELSVGFNAQEIRRSPGSANDVSRILLALPSTAKVADNANDLAVRGGSPMENGFYVDGIPVPNINHFPVQGASGGPIGILNIDFIDRVDFLVSGFSASYGDRLSSIVDIGFRNGSTDAFYGKAFLSFAGFGGMAEGPLPHESGAWMFSANKSYLDLIVGAIGTGVAPEYWDTQGKVSLHLSKQHTLLFLGIGARSSIEFDKKNSIEEGDRQYGTSEDGQGTVGARWDAFWSPDYYSTTTLSYSGSSFNNDFKKVTTDGLLLSTSNTERNVVLRTVHNLQLGRGMRLETGVDGTAQRGTFDTFFASDTNQLGIKQPDRTIKKDLTSTKGALFATLVASLNDRWALSAGVRVDFFALGKTATASPRVAISYSPLEDLTLHVRGGLFTQQLPLVVLSGSSAFETLPVMRAYHAGVGAEYLLRPDTKLTVEAYVKEYRNLPLDTSDPTSSVVDDALFNRRFTIYDNLISTGKAYTRGVEFMLQRKMADGIYGIVSGSYFRSRYEDAFGVWRDRVYDNEWIFSVIGGYKPNQDWEFSVRWTYAGGGPYTPFDPQASAAANIGIIDQSRVQAARFPDYHSLNLRVDRKFYFSSHMLDIYLSVWNAYNHKNIAGYFWNATENKQDVHYQWSVLPVLGVEYEF